MRRGLRIEPAHGVDVTDITKETVKWHFTISVPLVVTTLILALTVSHLKLHALFKPILQFLGLGVWV